jgi:hypothetical protein
MSVENRKYPRHSIWRPARIATLDGSTARADLLDISQGGARLKVKQPASLPEQFLLMLSGNIQRWSRLAWHSGKEVGVEFLAAPEEPADPEAKRAVLITCPRTSKRIPTGIQLSVPGDLSKILKVRRFTHCPFCKIVHGWLPSDATLGEVSIS